MFDRTLEGFTNHRGFGGSLDQKIVRAEGERFLNGSVVTPSAEDDDRSAARMMNE